MTDLFALLKPIGRFIGKPSKPKQIDLVEEIDQRPLLAESPLKCRDCGTLYRDFALDVIVPDEQWRAIGMPENGSGILCAGCIVRRGTKIPGVSVAKMRFE